MMPVNFIRAFKFTTNTACVHVVKRCKHKSNQIRVAIIKPTPKKNDVVQQARDFFEKYNVKVDIVRLYGLQPKEPMGDDGESESSKEKKKITDSDVVPNLSLNWIMSQSVNEVEDLLNYDCIILPDGDNNQLKALMSSRNLMRWLIHQESRAGRIAAIGNAMLAICCFRLGNGKYIVCEDKLKHYLEDGYGIVDGPSALADNRLITSKTKKDAEKAFEKITQEIGAFKTK